MASNLLSGLANYSCTLLCLPCLALTLILQHGRRRSTLSSTSLSRRNLLETLLTDFRTRRQSRASGIKHPCFAAKTGIIGICSNWLPVPKVYVKVRWQSCSMHWHTSLFGAKLITIFRLMTLSVKYSRTPSAYVSLGSSMDSIRSMLIFVVGPYVTRVVYRLSTPWSKSFKKKRVVFVFMGTRLLMLPTSRQPSWPRLLLLLVHQTSPPLLWSILIVTAQVIFRTSLVSGSMITSRRRTRRKPRPWSFTLLHPLLVRRSRWSNSFKPIWLVLLLKWPRHMLWPPPPSLVRLLLPLPMSGIVDSLLLLLRWSRIPLGYLIRGLPNIWPRSTPALYPTSDMLEVVLCLQLGEVDSLWPALVLFMLLGLVLFIMFFTSRHLELSSCHCRDL